MLENHTFHKPMRQRAVCAKRFANGWANAHPWVRARGAHCGTAYATPKGKTIIIPMARSLRGGCRRVKQMLFQRRGAAGGTLLPMASSEGSPPPKAPRQRHIKWHAIALCETVPQCAPCARTQGTPSPHQWLSASHKPRATALACEMDALRPILSRPSACERQIAKPLAFHSPPPSTPFSPPPPFP